MSKLELIGVSKRFGGLAALESVGFSVGSGDMVGLIGPNGAGKSTLVNVMSGSLRPSSGQTKFGTIDITKMPAYSRARIGIIRTHQTPKVFRRLSVAENVTLAALATGRGCDALTSDALIKELELDRHLNQSVESLNIVGRHRVEIARCLLAAPEILLLDEPTAGMSADEAKQTISVVQRWQDRMGFGVLLIEHNLSLVSSTVSRLVVLNFGGVIAEGATHDVLSDVSVVAAYLGDADRC